MYAQDIEEYIVICGKVRNIKIFFVRNEFVRIGKNYSMKNEFYIFLYFVQNIK